MSSLAWPVLAVIFLSSLTAALCAVIFLRAPLSRRGRADRAGNAMPQDPLILTLDDDALLHASPAAQDLIERLAPLSDGATAQALFAARFPDLADALARLEPGQSLRLTARRAPQDPALLDLTRAATGGAIEFTLTDPRPAAALRHRAHVLGDQLTRMEAAAERAPHPIWILDAGQRLVWGNAAYRQVARMHLGPRAATEPLFDPDDLAARTGPDLPPGIRCAVAGRDPGQRLWYDISRVPFDGDDSDDSGDGQTIYFATDVTAVVRAEETRQTFVQTLTKTFAHLSIGLAIFDRNRQLALFNPALIDLTELGPDFLSQRPNLMTFFDRLRETRVMPEPKNYVSWRETLADVVIAANDGRYSETWNLPSGLTYRVTGRPHPDGAVAFLFEDISAEISLTRRFREELEIGHAVLDTLDSAVAVFASSGRQLFCNAAYERLWGMDADAQLGDITVNSSARLWQTRCQPSAVWSDMTDRILSFGARAAWEGQVRRLDGRPIRARVQPLTGGATMVRFDPAALAALDEAAGA